MCQGAYEYGKKWHPKSFLLSPLIKCGIRCVTAQLAYLEGDLLRVITV